jgi:hypothetical protein
MVALNSVHLTSAQHSSEPNAVNRPRFFVIKLSPVVYWVAMALGDCSVIRVELYTTFRFWWNDKLWSHDHDEVWYRVLKSDHCVWTSYLKPNKEYSDYFDLVYARTSTRLSIRIWCQTQGKRAMAQEITGFSTMVMCLRTHLSSLTSQQQHQTDQFKRFNSPYECWKH